MSNLVAADLLQIANILQDNSFSSECTIFKKSYLRLRVRLRNNIFVSKLKQISNSIALFRSKFQPKLFRSYRDSAKVFISESKKTQLNSFLNTISDLIESCDKITTNILYVYSSTQAQLSVGHLIHHLIVIRSSLARLQICFKGVLVYATDLCLTLSTIIEVDRPNLQHKELNKLLLNHDCKIKKTASATFTKVHEHHNHVPDNITLPNRDPDIGKLIDRSTMQVVDEPQTSKAQQSSTSNPNKQKPRSKKSNKKQRYV